MSDEKKNYIIRTGERKEIGMKWRRKIVTGFVLPILFAAAGCAVWADSQKEAEEPLRAVIFYQAQIWVQDINIMQQIAQSIEAGLEGHSEVALSCYGTEEMSMTDAMRAAVNMKTNVMICYGLDSEEARRQYQILADHGIRVIMVDGDVKESGRLAYIGTDNYGAGIQAAEIVLEERGAESSIAVLAPSLETRLRSVGARLEGFDAAAAENGMKIEAYCETTYDSLTAIERIESLLDEHPDLDVLFCSEAVSGQAAADVIDERGLNDEILVITYDRNQNIEDDLRCAALDVTLVQDTEAIGRSCAEILIALAEDRTIEKAEDVLFPCIPVTLEDLGGENREP